MSRSLITLLLATGSLAVVIGLYVISNSPQAADDTPAPTPETPPIVDTIDQPPTVTPRVEAQPTADTPAPVEANASVTAVDTLTARDYPTQPEPVIGSTDPESAFFLKAELNPYNAGLNSIHLSRYSHKALEQIPYNLQEKIAVFEPGATDPYYYYPFGAHSIEINGQRIALTHQRWKVLSDPNPETNNGVVEMELVIESKDAAGEATPVARLHRTITLEPGRYDLQLDQSIENLTGTPLTVSYFQFGPGDMGYEPSYLGDKRTVNFGYTRADDTTGRVYIRYETGKPRKDIVGDNEKIVLWNAGEEKAQGDQAKTLTFAALTNRYFITAITANIPSPNNGETPAVQPIDRAFPLISHYDIAGGHTNGDPTDHDKQKLMIMLGTGTRNIAPGQSLPLDIALYTGPKEPKTLRDSPVYHSIGLDKLVIYNIGSCCSFLTFAWLGALLLKLLHFFHMIVADWGVAIILLTVVVRLILHPITKKSQLNMMRFSKQMQGLQPEIEKLKKKHKDDSQKLNQEMMKLYREKGVNPAGMAMGCFPMFLQMPIWIALYAMLFFAIELRHQPAFYDVFHRIGEAMGVQWSFLTDLSTQDGFIPIGAGFDVPFIGWHVTHINLLPILMMFVFLAQQKLMQPPQTTEMSDQAKQQQKIMKFMMLMFPIFLYMAPSGLTLYMLASSLSGIIDSKIVRRKLKQLEEAGELDKPAERKPPKPGGFMDRMQKAAEARQKELMERQQQAQKGGKPKRKR